MEKNDCQAGQINSAKEAAHEREADLQVIHIEHDAVMQGQEVLKLLYSPGGTRPDGILSEAVGMPPWPKPRESQRYRQWGWLC